MKKSILIAAVVSTTLLLSACGSKNKTQTASTDNVGVDVCDTYVSYLRCVAENLGDKGLATQEALDQTIESWKDYSNDELTPICEGAIDGLQKVQDMYADFDCSLNIVDENVDADVVLTGDDTNS